MIWEYSNTCECRLQERNGGASPTLVIAQTQPETHFLTVARRAKSSTSCRFERRGLRLDQRERIRGKGQ
jgi:hypothetical protein